MTIHSFSAFDKEMVSYFVIKRNRIENYFELCYTKF